MELGGKRALVVIPTKYLATDGRNHTAENLQTAIYLHPQCNQNKFWTESQI